MFALLMLTLGMPMTASTELACARSFDTVVERHFAAIQSRDLQVYMSTIGPRDGDLMILPDGTIWDSREAIAQGHSDWFADASWSFHTEPLRRVEREQFGLVVVRTQVRRPDGDSQPFLLSILFAREDDGCWYLLHDQNTTLPPE